MGRPKGKSASKVDSAAAAAAAVTPPTESAPAAAVTPPTKSKKRRKRGAKHVAENEVVGSKKQKIVNGGVELVVEKHTFETEIQKDQTNLSEVCMPEEEQNKVEVAPTNESVVTAQDAMTASRNPSEEGHKGDSSKMENDPKKSVEVALANELVVTALDAKEASNNANEEEHGDDNSKEEGDPKKSDTNVEKVDAPSLKKTPQATGSKTLFVGNLSFSIEEDDVKNFFKDVGEIAGIRFGKRDDRFAGYGHVEFTTPQAAQEALKLNNTKLVDRPVMLDLAFEKGKRAAEKEVVGSKKQKIVNGGVEVAGEKNTFEMNTQKEQTNSLEEHMPKEEQNKLQDTNLEKVDAPSLKKTLPASGSKTLFMGNLSYSIEKHDVKNFFKDVGKIAAIRFGIREGRFGGFGHVEFTTPEAAQEALKLNSTMLLGRQVILHLATEKGARPPTRFKTVCLSNLSNSIEEDDIKNFFKIIGEVEEVRFAMKDDQFVGFAQVEFTTAEAAQEALKLDKVLLLDLPVKIDLLKEQRANTSPKEHVPEEEHKEVEVAHANESVVTAQDVKKASNVSNKEEHGGDSSKKEDSPKKRDTDVEKFDDPSMKNTPQATGSKCLFMGNLSFSIEEDDVRNFFKDAGEIHEIRFCMKEDRFAGYGHIEFTTPEAAQEALKLNNNILVGRHVKLDLARERAAQRPTTPKATESKAKTLHLGNLSCSVKEDDVKNFFKDVGEVAKVLFAVKDNRPVGFGWVEFTNAQAAQEALKLNNELLLDQPVELYLAKEQGEVTPVNSKEESYQKGGQVQGKTIYIWGFNTSDGFDNIRSKLEEHFGKCGEISRLSIPKNFDSGAPKGVAFIEFEDSNGVSQALQLNGSELGGNIITVEEAKHVRDHREGYGRGGRRGGYGGRFSGSRGGGRGRGPSGRW